MMGQKTRLVSSKQVRLLFAYYHALLRNRLRVKDGVRNRQTSLANPVKFIEENLWSS